jgi:hypothetical protein
MQEVFQGGEARQDKTRKSQMFCSDHVLPLHVMTTFRGVFDLCYGTHCKGLPPDAHMQQEKLALS